MRLAGIWVYGLGLAIALSATACGGSQAPAGESTAPAGAASSGSGAKVDPATAADIKGLVTVDGAVPENVAIKMNADPVCARQVSSPQSMETYMVGSDGKTLGNPTAKLRTDQAPSGIATRQAMTAPRRIAVPGL